MSAEHEEELWFVELPDGRTRAMTLEDLDAAYQKGEVAETTRIRQDGSTEWSTLGAVAGLDEDAPDPYGATVPSAPPPPLSAGPSSLSPYALNLTPTPGPIAIDDLDDLPYAAVQKSSKGLVFGMLGGVALAIGMTVFFVARSQATADVVVKAIPAAAANALPPPAANDPVPVPLDNNKPKLTEEQKKKLAEGDKKRDAENARKAQERAERAQQSAPRRGRGKSSEPFVKGGSKYDPLNGAL
jgi:hypothetical protein